MPVVQCPSCGKKMNLREPKPGKKLRCPGCEEPFTPFPAKGSGGPAKRRRPAPVDDYGDEEDEPAPRRSSKRAGKKSGGKKKKKSAAAGKKSKLPLFLGIGVLAAALVGGVTFMLMSSGGDGNAETGPAPDAVAGNDPVGGAGAGGGHGADGHGAGGSAVPGGNANAMPMLPPPSGVGTPTTAESTAPATTSSVPSTSATTVSLQWLPQETEGVLHVNIERLLTGPIGQLLQNPMATQPLQEFRSKTGFGPEDIQSVTVGIGGVSGLVSSGQQPSPQNLPFVGVIRTKNPIDAAKIQAAIPNAQEVEDGSLKFIRIPEDPPAAIWFADTTTAVIGTEAAVRQASANSSPPSGVDTALFDGQSVMQALFSPKNADAIFRHPNFQVPPQTPPVVRTMVDAIRQHVTAVSIGFDLTKDIGFTVAARCRDAAGAQAMAAAYKATNDENKAQAAALAQSPQAQMMGPMLEVSRKMAESMKIETVDTMVRSTMTATDGGEQLMAFVPMMMGQMMAQGVTQARSAARRVQSKNNLKQIALAMHNFHDVYRRFPNAAPQSPTGEKWLSWRVHLLPFLEEAALYERFNLEEPWDSPTNRPLADQMPNVFRSVKATSVEPGKTLYQVAVGPGTAFEDAKGHGMREFTDGTSTTILVVEVAPERAVYWTQPEDFPFNPENPLDGLGGVEDGGFQTTFADGSVKFISTALEAETIKAMFTRNGGEPIPPEAFTSQPGPSGASLPTRGNSTASSVTTGPATTGPATTVNGIALEPRKALNDKVELLVPSGFVLMPENLLNVKFPLQRPDLAFTDEGYTTTVAVTEAKNPVTPGQLSSVKPDVERVFRLTADGELTRNDYFMTNGPDGMTERIFLEFKSKSGDIVMHNIVAAAPLDGRLLLVTFTTTEEQKDTWLNVGQTIIQSLKVKG